MKSETLATLRRTLNPRHREFWLGLMLPWLAGAFLPFLLTALGCLRLSQDLAGSELFGLQALAVAMVLAGPASPGVLAAWQGELRWGRIVIPILLAVIFLAVVLMVHRRCAKANGAGNRFLIVSVISLCWHMAGLIHFGLLMT